MAKHVYYLKDKGFSITIDDKALNAQLKRAFAANPKETVKAARECLLDLADISKERAPLLSGDLRSDCTAVLNGTVIFTKQKPTGSAVSPKLSAFGAVGYSLPYSVRQHEELGYNHPLGGEAKFLERPFNENKARYIKRFQRIVKDVVK